MEDFKFTPSIITDNFNFNEISEIKKKNKKLKITKKNLSINSINIFYLNAQGFNEDKQRITFNFLNNFYDIIFISESWYLNFYEIIKNPCFLATTPLPIKRNQSRPGNGIFCFANTSIKPFIKVLHIDEYSIVIKVFSKILMAVYYPPSLKRYRLEKYLANAYNTDIIFGDFNIDIFDNKDKEKKFLTLSIYLKRKLLKWIHLVLKDRYSNIPKWDHVFSKDSLNVNLFVGQPPFYSYHLSLEIQIKLNESIQLSEDPTSNLSFFKKNLI